MITESDLIKIINKKKIIVSNIENLSKEELITIIEFNNPIWKIYDWITKINHLI